MRLFVWHNVLTDYTDGVMFALANSEEEARELIIKEMGNGVKRELEAAKCAVYNSPVGFGVWGGG